MQKNKVILTLESITDIVQIAVYIESNFGKNRADLFQTKIEEKINQLSYMGNVYVKTSIKYRGYIIQKQLFSPSIIFYVVKEYKKEVHVLRVLREEREWKSILTAEQNYTYLSE